MEATHALQPTDALHTMRTQTVLVAGAGVAGRGVISMLCALGARTVVVATHDPFVLEHADEVLAL